MAATKADEKTKNETKEPEKGAQDQTMNEMLQAMMQMKEELSGLKSELEAQKKENEVLRRNSVHSTSPMGSESDYERVQKACMDAAKENVDPWNIKISVLSPRIGKGEDSYWLCVNGKSVQVPANDRYFELALPFAQCLVDEIKARYRAADFADSIQVYDPKENPHPVEKIV